MAIPVDLLVCVGMALATIGYAIKASIDLYRTERKTSDEEFQEAVARVREIVGQLPKLLESEGTERQALCRQIAGLIFEDCRSLLYLANCSVPNGLPEDEDTRKLWQAAISQIWDVYRTAYWLSFLLRFRPSLVRDCRKVIEATLQHALAWSAYLRLLRAQFPAEYEHPEIPDNW